MMKMTTAARTSLHQEPVLQHASLRGSILPHVRTLAREPTASCTPLSTTASPLVPRCGPPLRLRYGLRSPYLIPPPATLFDGTAKHAKAQDFVPVVRHAPVAALMKRFQSSIRSTHHRFRQVPCVSWVLTAGRVQFRGEVPHLDHLAAGAADQSRSIRVECHRVK